MKLEYYKASLQSTNQKRMMEIIERLVVINEKRDMFVDSEITTEEYETYRLQAIALRAEYIGLE